MDRFIQAIKRHAGDLDSQRGVNRWGIVQNVNPNHPISVRVLLQPEGVLTGWLPVLQSGAGAGWTFGVVPKQGWQCFLGPDAGDGEHGVVLGFAHNDSSSLPGIPNALGTGGTPNAAAAGLVAGEIFAMGPGGSVLRFCADGSVYIKGTLKVDGNIVANGDVSDRHGSLDRLRGNYDAHTHGNVQNGGGATGTTSLPDPE